MAESLADAIVKRLSMYKLRAQVAIGDSGLHLQRGTGPAPEGAQPDPRHPALGWRAYTPRQRRTTAPTGTRSAWPM